MTLSYSADAASIADGTVSTIIGVNADKCLGVEESSNSNGALLQSQTCSDSNYQQWKMEKDSANYFVLKNVGSGKCADVTAKSKDKGTKLQQWSCHYKDNQKWNISDQGNGEYAILSKYSDMVMDVYRARKSNGASIVQWPWSGKDNQKWSFGTNVESDSTDSSNSPIGFAADVTGGEGGSVVTVTTPAQLKDAFSGNTPRIIRV
jgi:hypothetical protein